MSQQEELPPPPGSQEAVDRGCTCPVVDNNYGRGRELGEGRVAFDYTAGCPVHKVPSMAELLARVKKR